MRAGRLRHKIEIQQVVETQSATGAVINTWQTYYQARASYEPKSGKEAYTAQQEHAQATAMFRMRYKAGITTKMRLIYDNRVFDIENVIDVYGRGRELQIMGVEHV
jgi:phage head-tail adaptor, putative, SPP1 family